MYRYKVLRDTTHACGNAVARRRHMSRASVAATCCHAQACLRGGDALGKSLPPDTRALDPTEEMILALTSDPTEETTLALSLDLQEETILALSLDPKEETILALSLDPAGETILALSLL